MPLTADDVRNRMHEIDGWQYDGAELLRTFTCNSFTDAMRFVNRVAVAAEQAHHHPDIDIRYNTVKLSLVTHSEGGITDKDFALAASINRAATE